MNHPEDARQSPAASPEINSSGVIARQATTGLAWMTLMTVIARVLGFAFQVALARLLSPEDFGLIATVSAINSFVSVLSGAGIREILIQRQADFKSVANAGFWFVMLGSILTAFVMMSAVLFDAVHRHDWRYVPLFATCGVWMLLSASQVVPVCQLTIALRFRTVAKHQFLATFVGGLTTVALAFFGAGAVSYFAGPAVGVAITAVLNWRVARTQIRLRLEPHVWTTFLQTGILLLLINASWALWVNIDNLLLGVLVPTEQLGYYFVAFGFSMQTIQLLGSNISAVIFPALGRLGHDPQQQKRAFTKAAKILALIAMPLGAGVILNADPIFRILYGAKYLPSIPIVQLLAIGICSLIVSSAAGGMMFAQGRFRTQLFYAISSVILVGVGVLVGSWLAGTWGCAIGVATGYWLTSTIGTRIALQGTDHPWRTIAALYVAPVLASTIALGVSTMLAGLFPPTPMPLSTLSRGELLLKIIVCSLAFCILYYGILRMISRQAINDLVHRCISLLPHRTHRFLSKITLLHS